MLLRILETGVPLVAFLMMEVTLLHHPDFVAFGALALLGQALLLGAAVSLRARRAGT